MTLVSTLELEDSWKRGCFKRLPSTFSVSQPYISLMLLRICFMLAAKAEYNAVLMCGKLFSFQRYSWFQILLLFTTGSENWQLHCH